MAESEGIEPPPVLPGLVFETNATNQHLPTFHYLKFFTFSAYICQHTLQLFVGQARP